MRARTRKRINTSTKLGGQLTSQGISWWSSRWNFVRDGVLELVDYGWFLRDRSQELVARTLNVLEDLTPVSFATATRGLHQGVAKWRRGRLLSTLGLLGRQLHSHAQANEGGLPRVATQTTFLPYQGDHWKYNHTVPNDRLFKDLSAPSLRTCLVDALAHALDWAVELASRPELSQLPILHRARRFTWDLDRRLGEVEPNVCVASLNAKVDLAAGVGAEFSTRTGRTPDVLLPVGGFRFVWTYQGRLCTQVRLRPLQMSRRGPAVVYSYSTWCSLDRACLTLTWVIRRQLYPSGEPGLAWQATGSQDYHVKPVRERASLFE
eukprot:SAG31_NODE_4520_length_3170_cov_2.797134_2_plen_321_part_00